jgi:hypothetical protein
VKCFVCFTSALQLADTRLTKPRRYIKPLFPYYLIYVCDCSCGAFWAGIENLMANNWIRVPYCKSNENILSYPFVVKALLS